MTSDRMEAFSDGVIAIIITIMVLELHIPQGVHEGEIWRLLPTLGGYALSFIYVGVYWNNHHHLLMTVERINGPVLWANLHLLFWLSLIPFTSGWMGERGVAPIPVAAYGVVLLMSAVAFSLLTFMLKRIEGDHGLLAHALGTDLKGKISPLLYLVAIWLAFSIPWISVAIYVAVAGIWFIPDRRVEREVHAKDDHPQADKRSV